MTLAQELAALLRRRGHAVRGPIRNGLAAFVEVVAEENPELDVEATRAKDEDEEENEDREDDVDDEELARNQRIICPHCGEPIEVAIDLSGDDQDGIQDCSVCCRPMRIRYSSEGGHLGSFSVDPA
jgi:hypothetical protein